MMDRGIPADSLLDHLGRIPDFRSRHGRSLPLGSMLGLLVLAALHGERSLRGMWIWGCNHWRVVKLPLGFMGNRKAPSYGELWTILNALETGLIETAFREWVASWHGKVPQALSVDGKTLRGSVRKDSAQPALEVVAAVGQELQVVLGQQEVGEGAQVEAALRLLRGIPLEGKLVIADAGLLCRPFVKTVLEGKGDYLGLVKDNQPEVKEALEYWIADDLFPPGTEASGR
ncbi:MAG: ISAs1 family transposase [Anaerolineae bacterium]